MEMDPPSCGPAWTWAGKCPFYVRSLKAGRNWGKLITHAPLPHSGAGGGSPERPPYNSGGATELALQLYYDDVEVVNHIPDQMVVPPRFILLDVQRAFFPWCAEDARAADADEVVTEVDGEQVAERWDRGRLVERIFTRTSGAPEGTIRVSYEWGRGDWALPERAVLDNGWFGYRLTIVTSSETRLESAGER